MKKLATLLRAGQLFAQNAHHCSSGISFFEDHEFFGETYKSIGKAYDNVIERGIGMDEIKCEDLQGIQVDAAKAVPETGAPKQLFYTQMKLDYEVCEEIEKLCKSGKLKQGTQNLLQGIADETEKRCCYLIKRKLK